MWRRAIMWCLSLLHTRQTLCRRSRKSAEGRTWRWTRDIWRHEFWPVWWRLAAGAGRTDPLSPAQTLVLRPSVLQHLKRITQPLFETEEHWGFEPFLLFVRIRLWAAAWSEEAPQIGSYQWLHHLLFSAVISYLPGLYIEAGDNDLLGLGMVWLSAPWKRCWKGWSTEHTKRFRISCWGNLIRLGWFELVKTDVGSSDTGF